MYGDGADHGGRDPVLGANGDGGSHPNYIEYDRDN